MYYEMIILPATGGFGLYQRGEANGEGWADANDLVHEMAQNIPGQIYELGRDDLPEGIEDIRGKIQGGDPDRLFAWQYRDSAGAQTAYVGIIEKD